VAVSINFSSNIYANFFKFYIFRKNHACRLLLTSFVSADVGNQLEVTPNARVADDALMQQCATVHCACKMEAMLTRETSESIDPYL